MTDPARLRRPDPTPEQQVIYQAERVCNHEGYPCEDCVVTAIGRYGAAQRAQGAAEEAAKHADCCIDREERLAYGAAQRRAERAALLAAIQAKTEEISMGLDRGLEAAMEIIRTHREAPG